MLIVHHNDHDGRFAAHLLGKMESDKGEQTRYLEANYGKITKQDILDARKGPEPVVMVDFSLPAEDMVDLWAQVDMLWIDHHVSAINDVQKALQNLSREEAKKCCMCVDSEKSGCLLAWEITHLDCAVPYGVQMIHEWDNGSSEYEVRVLAYGVMTRDQEPGVEGGAWDYILDQNGTGICVDTIREDGETVLRYADAQFEEWFETIGYETTLAFDGTTYKVFAINAPLKHDAFSVLDPAVKARVDLFARTTRNETEWTVTLYTSDDDSEIDCSVIAKAFGGGGHKGAAGFRCESLPFGDGDA